MLGHLDAMRRFYEVPQSRIYSSATYRGTKRKRMMLRSSGLPRFSCDFKEFHDISVNQKAYRLKIKGYKGIKRERIGFLKGAIKILEGIG